MDAIEAIHARRSIRDYEPRGVARGVVEAVLWDAAQAPSTPVSGERPWAFNVIEGAERIAEYGARAKAYAREHKPAGAGYAWADREDFSVFFNAPVVVVISGRSENSQAVQECCRAGQTLMISATARGLGTCWVGSPLLWMSDPAVRAELSVPEGFEPYAVFTLGYPRTTPDGKPRGRPEIIWSGV
jgi:nitroreductase